MCYSKAEGGQRCYAHSRERVARAVVMFKESQHAAAPSDSRTEAMYSYQRALCELASTTQGAEDIKALRSQDPENAARWGRILEAGDRLRDRNTIVRHVAAARANGSAHPLAGHVSAEAIAEVDAAVAAALTDENLHLHFQGDRIKRVKPRFRTNQEKDASVAHWRGLLEGHTSWAARCAVQDRARESFFDGFAQLEAMAANPDTATMELGDAVQQMILNPRPAPADNTDRPSRDAEGALRRQSARRATLITLIYAARLHQALHQPVQP